MFLEISQNSQESRCAGVSLLIKLQAWACNLIKKGILAQVFSCEFCGNSKSGLSYRTPPLAASERAIPFSDKGLRERERERGREKEREREPPKEKVLQYPTLMRSSRREHSIDVSDNIYGCLSRLSCRCFFKIMIFLDRFRQCFKHFSKLLQLWEVAVSWIYKKILKKNSMMKSRFINVAKRRI